MRSRDMMSLLKNRIDSCYKQLLSARNDRYMDSVYIEGFRCRLDELILHYHLVRDISFCEACEELKIPYKDVNVLEDEE